MVRRRLPLAAVSSYPPEDGYYLAWSDEFDSGEWRPLPDSGGGGGFDYEPYLGTPEESIGQGGQWNGFRDPYNDAWDDGAWWTLGFGNTGNGNVPFVLLDLSVGPLAPGHAPGFEMYSERGYSSFDVHRADTAWSAGGVGIVVDNGGAHLNVKAYTGQTEALFDVKDENNTTVFALHQDGSSVGFGGDSGWTLDDRATWTAGGTIHTFVGSGTLDPTDPSADVWDGHVIDVQAADTSSFPYVNLFMGRPNNPTAAKSNLYVEDDLATYEFGFGTGGASGQGTPGIKFETWLGHSTIINARALAAQPEALLKLTDYEGIPFFSVSPYRGSSDPYWEVIFGDYNSGAYMDLYSYKGPGYKGISYALGLNGASGYLEAAVTQQYAYLAVTPVVGQTYPLVALYDTTYAIRADGGKVAGGDYGWRATGAGGYAQIAAGASYASLYMSRTADDGPYALLYADASIMQLEIVPVPGQVQAGIALWGSWMALAPYNGTADPAAPNAGEGGRLYMRDNGSGKAQFAVRFPTGAVQVLATEP